MTEPDTPLEQDISEQVGVRAVRFPRPASGDLIERAALRAVVLRQLRGEDRITLIGPSDTLALIDAAPPVVPALTAERLNAAAHRAGRRHPDDISFGSDILAALQGGPDDRTL